MGLSLMVRREYLFLHGPSTRLPSSSSVIARLIETVPAFQLMSVGFRAICSPCLGPTRNAKSK